MPKCSICSKVYGCINDIYRHLKISHSLDKYTPVVKCGEDNCYQSYSNWGDLRRHYNSYHRFTANSNDNTVNYDSINVCDQEVNAKTELSTSIRQEFHASHEVDSNTLSDVTFQQDLLNDELLKRQLKYHATELVSKLYAKPGQPRSMVQEFINDTSDFLSTSLTTLEQIVKSKLQSHNLSTQLIDEVCTSINVLKQPFHGLTSEHYRLKFLKDEGYYIEPKEYYVTSAMTVKRVNKELQFELSPVHGMSMPLRKTLKLFLELPGVYNIVINALNSPKTEGFIGEYIHGPHWQFKKRQFEGKVVVPLFIYYDDYEVDKDLGPHSAKLGAVYVKIACLPFEFQGAIENIFQAILFCAADRVEFGNPSTFRKFVKEITFLQTSGINITTQGNSIQVYFTIGLIIADNLAMHCLLGFAEGFTANYICRFCYVFKKDMHTECVEDPALLRDKVQHNQDILKANLTETGVSGKSVFESIHDPTDNPSFDIMHDLWEGAATYDMQHILNHLINVKKYFTLDDVNFRIISFDYGLSVSNKPTQLKDAKTVKMTASEMKTFVCTFALLVGDLVEDSDPVWEFYLILRDIVDILLCMKFQEELLVILANKISEHHRLYIELFNDTLKPKHHFMVHYPSIIRLSGSPYNFSCDRFEAKHQPSVKDARATTSRRNIVFTLSVKEQLRFANRLLMKKGLQTVLEVGPDTSTFVLPFLPEGFNNNECFETKFVVYKGTRYEPKTCVVTGVDSDNGPEFGLIEAVFVNFNNNVCFLCRTLSVISYVSHYHAYMVKCTNCIVPIHITDLLDFHPVLFCKGFEGHNYVSLHHML